MPGSVKMSQEIPARVSTHVYIGLCKYLISFQYYNLRSEIRAVRGICWFYKNRFCLSFERTRYTHQFFRKVV